MLQIGKKQASNESAVPKPSVVPDKLYRKADWADRKVNKVGVEDMTLLTAIRNEAIFDNLEKRFREGEIYTYIGHVLISVNPFRELPIYTQSVLESYVDRNRLEMAPHVFAIAETMYRQMVGYQERQCVIISGESGAGKTEAAKKIMQYIASVSGGSSNSQIQQIKDMVLATNPLLESFGNAKTLRNNNSSRFGKYLEIQFNSHGEPVGANVINYLLEKGRVVSQIKNERNFHIFYQFCAGASQEYRDTFGIGSADHYLFTCQSGCMTVNGMNDAEEYQDVLTAMKTIGIAKNEQDSIHRLLAAILWLGNISFVTTDNEDQSQITDRDALDTVAYLLDVPVDFVEKSLCSRLVETNRGGRRGTSYEVPLNLTQATAVRDALAKAIYERLFDWIVARVNNAMRQRGEAPLTIGVLDIYGFEIFDHNSFEQLCINYVNEKLQQIFIELTLKAEQEDYVAEGIKWTPIEFFNNKIVCDLIEEKRPPGVFSILNDSCATAHADSDAADRSFQQRLGSISSHPHFHNRGDAFIIKHYAGDVIYEIRSMTDKNKDQLNRDLISLMQMSTNQFTKSLFPDEFDSDSKKRPPTASDRIKTSAQALVDTLMACTPSYIRCIKPNSNKSAKEFDEKMVLHQIKYLGLLENIRVRRAGFAYRQPAERFLERFYMLSRRTCYAGEVSWTGDPRKGCEIILNDSGIGNEEWQIGRTKAFIKRPETLFELEAMRERYWHTMAIRIQRQWRKFILFRHKCARKIQAAWRESKGLNVYIQMRDYGHQVLSGRKERRRFSLISYRRYLGDYLDVAGNGGKALREVANLAASELIIFSEKIHILVSRMLRSNKLSPRILLLTDKYIYVIVTKIENNIAVQRVDRQIDIKSITHLSMSNLQDDFLVIHLGAESDLVLVNHFKTELASYLVHLGNGRIKLAVASEIEYTNSKDQKKGKLKFVRDDTLPPNMEAKYKKDKVTVGPGEPPGSVSHAPPPRKQRPRQNNQPRAAPQKAAAARKPAAPAAPAVANNAYNNLPPPPVSARAPAPMPPTQNSRMPAPAPPTVTPRQPAPPPAATAPAVRQPAPAPAPAIPTPAARQPAPTPAVMGMPRPPMVPTQQQGGGLKVGVPPPPSFSPRQLSDPKLHPVIAPHPPTVLIPSSMAIPNLPEEPAAPAPAPAPRVPARSNAPQPRKDMFKAIYEFRKEEEGELTVQGNEIVEILDKDENGWWLARNSSGEEGWVPSNYLEEVKSGQAPAPPPRRPSAPASRSSSDANIHAHEVAEQARKNQIKQSSSPTTTSPVLVKKSFTKSEPVIASSPAVPAWKAELAARKAANHSNNDIQSLAADPAVPSWKQELAARRSANNSSSDIQNMASNSSTPSWQQELAAKRSNTTPNPPSSNNNSNVPAWKAEMEARRAPAPATSHTPAPAAGLKPVPGRNNTVPTPAAKPNPPAAGLRPAPGHNPPVIASKPAPAPPLRTGNGINKGPMPPSRPANGPGVPGGIRPPAPPRR
ncbi:P-loop containing nucleoside triphosphate hydrolase protein [Paraphysoderma sedebokerense]|nr:P-loop containing nucleoside triphosphate hydrolase protein [Paraphysoderma sedebokerense]